MAPEAARNQVSDSSTSIPSLSMDQSSPAGPGCASSAASYAACIRLSPDMDFSSTTQTGAGACLSLGRWCSPRAASAELQPCCGASRNPAALLGEHRQHTRELPPWDRTACPCLFLEAHNKQRLSPQFEWLVAPCYHPRHLLQSQLATETPRHRVKGREQLMACYTKIRAL